MSYVTFIEKWISLNMSNRAIFLYGYGIVKHTIYIDRIPVIFSIYTKRHIF